MTGHSHCRRRARAAHERVGDRVAGDVRLAPAVVDDALLHRVVVVREELGQVAAARPRDVVPQDGRLVAVDELAAVRRDVVDVLATVGDGQHGVGRLGQDRVVVGPVVAARVVEAHAHPLGAHGLGQVADEVTLGVVLPLRRVPDGRGPQGEPVVVFGREHDVAGAGDLTQVGDGVEVGPGRGVVERLDEPVVGVVVAVDLGVVPLGRAAHDLHAVEVPLGVGVLPQHPLRAVLDEQLLDVGHPRRPARHRIEAPVEEDPQLGVVVPDGHSMVADGFPRPLIHGGCILACLLV